MGIAASTLLPIEEVVACIATQVSLPVRDPKGLEVYSTAAQLVAEMIAEAVVPAYLCSPVSGQVHELPTLAAGGYSAFELYLDSSLAIFVEPFEPFGSAWPNPTADTVVGWVEAWRFAKEQGSVEESLLSILGDGEAIEDVSEFKVDTPVYCVCIRQADAEALVAACSAEAQAQTQGSGARRQQAKAAADPLPRDGSPLTTEQAARYLGFKPYTLRRWRSRGKGPRYIKSEGRNGRVGYRVEDLETWTKDVGGRSSRT